MYWSELNRKRVGQLRDWLSDKSIIVVGNSVKMLSNDYGDIIDSYDVVVRLGKGLTEPNLYKNIGTKTDIWFSGMLRAGLYNRVDCKWKILTPSTKTIYDTDPFIPVNKALFNDDFHPYKHYFWSDSVENTRNFWMKMGFDKDTRPSQGIICCDFLARIVKKQTFDIIGFDFFTEKIIINDKEYTSWHLPNKVGPPDNVAHGVKREKNIMGILTSKYDIRLLPYKE